MAKVIRIFGAIMKELADLPDIPGVIQTRKRIISLMAELMLEVKKEAVRQQSATNKKRRVKQ